MVKYEGRDYTLYPYPWSGEAYCYLVDGNVRWNKPSHKRYLGYIMTENGAVFLYETSYRLPVVLGTFLLILMSVLLCNPKEPVAEYYPVAFAEAPLYQSGTLYCNVVNLADCDVQVRFGNDATESMLYEVRQGDTLPYLELGFVPTYIEYDQKYKFTLEVRYD